MKLVPILLLASVCVFSSSYAAACSCAGSDSCGITQRGEVVFLGTVISKQVSNNVNPDGTLSFPVPSKVRFTVTESFRGVGANEIVIASSEGGGGCGYRFRVGQSYLVFANRFEGKLMSTICTDTQPSVSAAALIQQLRAVKAGSSAASVFGVVARLPKGIRVEDKGNIAPFSGIKVRLVGSDGAEFTTQSDTDGAFEFRGLPPGSYEVAPVLPLGMTTRDKSEKKPLKVTATLSSSCARNIWVYWDGRISGRVVDPQGHPIAGAVTAQPADLYEFRESSQRGGQPLAVVGDDGHFEVPLLWPGKYRLEFVPTIGGPIRTSYSPQIIDLGKGQHVQDVVFVYRANSQ